MRERTHLPQKPLSKGTARAAALAVRAALAACTAFTVTTGAAASTAPATSAALPAPVAAAADRPPRTADTTAADINIAALHSGMCLEAASAASGEPVRQRNCAGRCGALWSLRQSSTGTGLVHLVNSASGLCTAVTDSSAADGAPVRQEGCGAQPGASFRLVDSAEGAWLQPLTASPRKCPGIAGSSVADRAALAQWACDSPAGIRFQQRRPPHEWRTTRVNSAGGKCLGIRNAGHAEREWALQRTCSGSADETWRIVTLGDDVAIINANSDKCLAATRDTDGANGSQTGQATRDGYPYQRWSTEELAPGRYALNNRLLNQYLGIRPPGRGRRGPGGVLGAKRGPGPGVAHQRRVRPGAAPPRPCRGRGVRPGEAG